LIQTIRWYFRSFGKEESKKKKYFMKETCNSNFIFASSCIWAVSIQLFLSELITWINPEYSVKSPMIRLAYISIFVSFIVVLVIKTLRRSYIGFKIIMTSLLLSRLGLQTLELVLIDKLYGDDYYNM
jgi:hypothetical protein